MPILPLVQNLRLAFWVIPSLIHQTTARLICVAAQKKEVTQGISLFFISLMSVWGEYDGWNVTH